MIPLDLADLRERYASWVVRAKEMHPEFQGLTNPAPAWRPLQKPLTECRVALVSTAGIHLKSQAPYDLTAHEGDWSVREIPGAVAAGELVASHSHYDTDGANQDINSVFPIDALRSLADEGFIGEVSPVHLGLMGFIPHSHRVRDEAGPAVADRLVRAEVDVAVLTPG